MVAKPPRLRSHRTMAACQPDRTGKEIARARTVARRQSTLRRCYKSGRVSVYAQIGGRSPYKFEDDAALRDPTRTEDLLKRAAADPNSIFRPGLCASGLLGYSGRYFKDAAALPSPTARRRRQAESGGRTSPLSAASLVLLRSRGCPRQIARQLTVFAREAKVFAHAYSVNKDSPCFVARKNCTPRVYWPKRG
jgi:hypothetical protein